MANYKRKRQKRVSQNEIKKRDNAIYIAYLRAVPVHTLATHHNLSKLSIYKIIRDQRGQYELTSEMLVDQLLSCDERIYDAVKQLRELKRNISERDPEISDSKLYQLHDSVTKIRKVIHEEYKFKADLLSQLSKDVDASRIYEEQLSKMTDEELDAEIEKLT